MKVYGIIELKSTHIDKLNEVKKERLADLENKYKEKIKILSIGEPKKEGMWYITFIEFEYSCKNLEDLFKFVTVETPAYLELDGPDIECSSEEFSHLLSKISNIYYKIKKFLNISTITYTEEGNSRWISPDLAEDLYLTDKDVKIIEFICEVNLAENTDEYIKPLFTTLSDFLPFNYSILRQEKTENGYILAIKVEGIVRKLSTLFYIIISYCPLVVIIKEPKSLKVKISELQEGLNALSSVMATVKTIVELKLQNKFKNKGRVQ